MRVLGVPVRVDGSWLLIGGLVAWVYTDFYGGYPGGAQGAGLIVGAALAAAGFFLSLLAHELGHALASRALGIHVFGITLFLMGGVTESAGDGKRPRDDFLVVLFGPLLSLAAAGVFFLLGRLGPPAPADTVAEFLMGANLLLAVFNLVPGYPLDGGRLLRAVLWGITGRPHAATRWAARVGQGFAALVAAYGVWAVVRSGGHFSGLWEVLLGVFLWRGATQAHARAAHRERLGSQRVRDVMGSVPPPLDPALTLADALERMQERPSILWPVGEPGSGTVTGGLTLAQIDAVADVDWHGTTVAAQALALEAVSISVEADLEEALARLAQAPGAMLLVIEDGRAVGLLTPSLLGFSSA